MSNEKRVDELLEIIAILEENITAKNRQLEIDVLHLNTELRGVTIEMERLLREDLAETLAAIRKDPSFVSVSDFRPVKNETSGQMILHWVGITATEMIGYEDSVIVWRSPIA